MTRQWQPGDVAIAFNDAIAFRVVRHDGDPDYWSAADGIWPTVLAARVELLNFRPLVVIDPEDREQAKALHDLWVAETRKDFPHEGWNVTCMQAALRAYANPTPPIEEPTGLGAVVEDADGRRWIRTEAGEFNKPWYRGDTMGTHAHWQSVNVARVLSEGVTE